MIKIKNKGIILEKTDNDFENQAVLNPSCVKIGDVTHMFYRAVRKGDFVSSIGYCQLIGDKVVKRLNKPIIFPQYDFEKMGVEDPRIVFLDGLYYLFYTAYDGKNALIAYATSTDLINFKKQGLISAQISYDEAEDLFRQSKVKEKYHFFETFFKDTAGKDVLLWEKDAFIFPEKIDGKFALIHRILPGIQIIYFDDFKDLKEKYWKEYLLKLDRYVLLDPKFEFESRNIGGGCPPVKTEDGWLLVYHAVEDSKSGKIYHAGVALLDLDDPMKIIGRLKKPLFSPVEDWEKDGDVHNVVFPTSALIEGDNLVIFYGAADSRIAIQSIDLKSLLLELKKSFSLNNNYEAKK